MPPPKQDDVLFVGLHEAKELGQVISNPTGRKVLGLLAAQHATESEIAQQLGLPLSTVHYNVQQLVKAKLVKADEFHYSARGKEVLHYQLAKRLVVLSPESLSLTKELLKAIPTVLGVGLFALGVQLFTRSTTEFSAQKIAAAPFAKDTALAAAAPLPAVVSSPPVALWFFVGGVCAILLYLLLNRMRK